MKNQLHLEYLILCKKDFLVYAKLPQETERFFHSIVEQGIQLIFCDYTLENINSSHTWNASNALAICAWDFELEILKQTQVGVIAYQNPSFGKQLFQNALIIVEGFEEVDFLFFERMFQRKHKLPWRITETKRTYIREMTLDDLPNLFTLYEKEGMTKYVEPLKVWDEEVEYTKSYMKYQYGYYGYGMWLVFLKETDQLIGRAGLDNHDYKDEVLLEMGYMIDLDFQRRGLATEVCQGIISYVRENLDFEKIYCFIQEKNIASKALANKLQFKKANHMPISKDGMIAYEKSLEV